ncbi:MAG: OmpA family protein [Planctomycetaceae bacterium]
MEEDDAPGVPEWVVTYGDMMSLLLTFFIMLVSLSEIVVDKKYRAILEALQKYTGYRTAPKAPPGDKFPLNEIRKKLETLGSFSIEKRGYGGVKNPGLRGKNLRVFRSPDGKSIMIGSPIPFEPGKYELSSKAKERLKLIAENLAGKPNKIELRGHVAPGPLPEGIRFDATTLSYLRARSVMQFLNQHKIPSDQLRISAMGQTRPLDHTGDKQSQFHDRVEIHAIDKFAEYYDGIDDG